MVITLCLSERARYVRQSVTLLFVGQTFILNFMTTDVCHLDVHLVMEGKSSELYCETRDDDDVDLGLSQVFCYLRRY